MSIKYARDEIERHWIADPGKLPPLEGFDFWQIDDHYLTGTRLRLRRIRMRDGSITYKLGKKYGRTTEYTEPIVSVYLDAAEYEVLSQLEGAQLHQTRYRVPYQGVTFNVNVYSGIPEILVEVEYPNLEAAHKSPIPDFCGREIIGEMEYEGWWLAQRLHDLGERGE